MSARSSTLALTAASLVAFAGNSLLCRWALGQHHIDAASFASIRVGSGALTLLAILLVRTRALPRFSADWRAVAGLAAYMVFFTFAYLSLTAGMGALILFGAVQITMFTAALRSGEPFAPLQWAGLTLAFAGLIYLVSPGLSAPEPIGAVSMAAAGVAWGVYSLRGRGVADPLQATATNFVFTLPIVLMVSLLMLHQFSASSTGVMLAIASGAITSGCGYVLWFAALRGLNASSAAVVQLSVPVIAAIAGVLILSEPVSLRLVLASAATLGGVAIVLAQRAAKKA